MGVLRTSELLAAHRIDGAEQYFTRAIDYGYSFDPQEVIRFWGRETLWATTCVCFAPCGRMWC
jgi:hypothetical protein